MTFSRSNTHQPSKIENRVKTLSLKSLFWIFIVVTDGSYSVFATPVLYENNTDRTQSTLSRRKRCRLSWFQRELWTWAFAESLIQCWIEVMYEQNASKWCGFYWLIILSNGGIHYELEISLCMVYDIFDASCSIPSNFSQSFLKDLWENNHEFIRLALVAAWTYVIRVLLIHQAFLIKELFSSGNEVWGNNLFVKIEKEN